MDGKKVYQIEINGIKESVNAVDALNKQLTELENRIKRLESSNVKVGAASSGGGTSSSKGSSGLNEEAKLAKQIEQTDAKREAYSKKIYQNYLAAKDILTETVNDQKQLAAAERLQADAYSNTMNGIKQKLADLKTVHFSTDMSSNEFKEQTKEINTLTQKLKECEEAYGQFGRNVGNYKSAFDGFEKVSVTIGGVTKEFNNLMQAQKAVKNEMGKLEVNSKQNTKEYKALEREAQRLAKAQLRLNSAMNDAKASSKVMDDLMDTMESFVALGQVGQGFSTLFGLDNSALEQQIAKLVALQNVLSGIEKIRQQMNTGEGIGGWFSDGSKGVDQFVAKLAGAEIRMGKIIGSSKQASIALNGLSTVLKGLGVGAIVGGTIMVINKLNEFSQTAVQAGDASKILGSSVDYTTEKLEKLRKTNVNNYLVGITDELGAANNSTNVFIKSLDTLIDRLKEMNEVPVIKFDSKIASEGLQNGLPTGIPTMLKALESMGIGDKEFKYLNPKPLQEFKKEFISLAKTIESYERPKSGWQKANNIIESILPDAITPTGQQRKALGAMGNYILGDYIKEIETTMNKAKKEMSTFGYVTDETKKHIIDLKNEMHDNEALNIIFANLDKFTRNSEQAQKVIDALRKAYEEFAESVANPKQLDPSRLLQLQIDAMADSEEKIRKQNELNRKKEISDANFNPEYTKAINAKYDRELQENLKAYRKSKKQEADQKKKEERDVQREIDEYTIQLMREGLEKQIAELRNEEKYKRKEIEDSGIRVGERTNLLTEVYNKKELELRRDWAREVLEIYRNLGDDIENIERDIFDSGLDTGETNLEANTSKKKQSSGDNLITPINYDDIEALKTYYKKILEIEQQAADEEVKIKEERLKKQLEYDKKDEERRHNNLVDSNNGEYVKQLEQGKITQEQYDELIERENKAHTEKMKAIDAQYAADSEKILQDSLDKKRGAYNTYYTSVIGEIRKQQDRITKDAQKAEVTDTAGFGIINIAQTRRNYKALIDTQKEAITKIQEEKKKLVGDKDSGKISGEDFLVRKEELDAAERAALESLKNLEDNSKNVVGKFMQSIQQYVQTTIQSIQGVLSAVWDAQDAAYEREQEELQKQIKLQEDIYNKQRELAEGHKDTINEIEDKLSTARGDRRQHLIDQLNAEIEAQRRAVQEQKKAEKEKQKLEKKAEKEELEQKKREKKRAIVQALINTALSISMAAVNAWPVPAIAMMAAAAAVGAAQIAAISSQKYAKGGLLEGKSHREGGIPVGNTGIEVEGKEYIVRKSSTTPNIELLDYINKSQRKLSLDDFIDFYSSGKARSTFANSTRKFEDGGMLPTLRSDIDVPSRLISTMEDYANRPYVVQVVDIMDKTSQVKQVQAMAGIEG